MYFWQVNLSYYNHWYYKLVRLNFLLKFGSALGTVIVIALWSCWPNYFIGWTLLVTAGQVASLYAEYACLSEKIMRLSYWAEDAQKVVNDITALWYEVNKIGELIDPKIILHRLQDLQDTWSALGSRFLHGITPYNSKVLKLAEEEAKDLLKNVHTANHEADAESKEEVTV